VIAAPQEQVLADAARGEAAVVLTRSSTRIRSAAGAAGIEFGDCLLLSLSVLLLSLSFPLQFLQQESIITKIVTAKKTAIATTTQCATGKIAQMVNKPTDAVNVMPDATILGM
jgi:hypothetical protein